MKNNTTFVSVTNTTVAAVTPGTSNTSAIYNYTRLPNCHVKNVFFVYRWKKNVQV